VVDLNQKIAQAGFDFADKPNLRIVSGGQGTNNKSKQYLLTGNQAAALGAMSAGLKFFAGYPMTPATGIMEFLAEWAEEYKIVVKHSEDEIAASLMAIGAGFSGARAMTATSGGGLCLMVESFGLATMAEVPLVVVDCQRPGPATGLPTRTSQGDLKLVAYGTVDSAPRIVLSPGDQEETFYLTKLAFNLAEIYQAPVFILLDKYLAESQASLNDLKFDLIKIDRGQSRVEPKENYNRFALTLNSISPRVLPGQDGRTYTAVGNEHNEFGDISEEPKIRNLMLKKRADKLAKVKISVADIIKPIKIYGPKSAKKAVVFWGSPKGAVLEAIKDLKDFKAIQVMQLRPFPKEEFLEAVGGVKRLILVENNFDGQLGDLIREQTGVLVNEKILRYDGRPFQFEEVKLNLL